MDTDSTIEASWYATPDEFAKLTGDLRSTHSELLDAVEVFPLEKWESAGSDGGWSAAQIVEHILLAQRVLREQIRFHLQDPVRPDLPAMMEQQFARLVRYLPGGGKAHAGKQSTAFQGLSPGGVAAEISAAEEQFSDLLTAAALCPIKAIGWNSPFFGELSALLWLHYPALHTTRHVAQLSRLRASFEDR